MKYIYATKGGIIALMVFVLVAMFVPGQGSNSTIEIILTVSALLFSITIGFFTARLNFRYNKITSLMATEDAYWLSLYKTMIFCDRDFANNVKELIDKYYITTYDFELGNYYKHNAKYLHAIYDEMKKWDMSNDKKHEQVFGSMINFLCEIEKNRNKNSVLSLEQITGGQWTVLTFLALIIIFCVFFLRTPEWYSQITSVVLSTAIVINVLVARDLQRLRLGGAAIVVESGQENLEFMGKLRYYNVKHLKDGYMEVPKHIKKYRLGLHEPGETFKIKIVNEETN